MKPIEVAYWEEDPTGSVKRDSPLLGDLALELSFAHPGLVDAHLLKHLKVFAGRFYSLTESVEQPCAPLVVYTLQKLMSEEFALCLSITGKDQPLQQTESGSRSAWMVPLANWLVDHELMHRRLWYSALVLPEPIHYRMGAQSFFFECPQTLLPVIFEKYWEVFRDFDIEGYVLPAASIPLLELWNRRTRDTELLQEIMDTIFAAFRGFRHNSGLLITTTKLDFQGFKQRIDLENLVRLGTLGQLPGS